MGNIIVKIKKIVFSIFALIAFVVMADSCGGISNDKIIADTEIVLKDTVTTGQELFRQNCAGCHGLNKEGMPSRVPSLVHINDSMSKEHVYSQIKNAKVLMHSFAYLPDNEIYTIISYLFNETDQHTTVKSTSLVDLGRNLVMSNCLSCHHLTVNDSVPLSAKILTPLVEPSALVGEAIQLSKEQFYLVLKTGPCNMPSFDFLNVKDKESIWIYLNSIKEKKN